MTDVQTSATIASLREQVAELRGRLDTARYENASLTEDVDHAKRMLARERERAGVLERECRKWRDEWTKRYNQNADGWMLAIAEMAETDRTNALDAAKFVGGGSNG